MNYQLSLRSLMVFASMLPCGSLEASVSESFDEMSISETDSSSKRKKSLTELSFMGCLRSSKMIQQQEEGEKSSGSPSMSPSAVRWGEFPASRVLPLKHAIRSLSPTNLNSFTWFTSGGPIRMLVTQSDLPLSLLDEGAALEATNGIGYRDERIVNFRTKGHGKDAPIYQVHLKLLGLSDIDFETLEAFHPLTSESFITPINDKKYRVQNIQGLKGLHDMSTNMEIDWKNIPLQEVSMARAFDDGTHYRIVYSYLNPGFVALEDDKDAFYKPENDAFKYFMVTLDRNEIA